MSDDYARFMYMLGGLNDRDFRRLFEEILMHDPEHVHAIWQQIKMHETIAGIGADNQFSDHQLRHIKGLMNSGQKVEAVKYVRSIAGMGLKEAKDWVESRVW